MVLVVGGVNEGGFEDLGKIAAHFCFFCGLDCGGGEGVGEGREEDEDGDADQEFGDGESFFHSVSSVVRISKPMMVWLSSR